MVPLVVSRLLFSLIFIIVISRAVAAAGVNRRRLQASVVELFSMPNFQDSVTKQSNMDKIIVLLTLRHLWDEHP